MAGDTNKDNKIDIKEFKEIYRGIINMELQIKNNVAINKNRSSI